MQAIQQTPYGYVSLINAKGIKPKGLLIETDESVELVVRPSGVFLSTDATRVTVRSVFGTRRFYSRNIRSISVFGGISGQNFRSDLVDFFTHYRAR